MAGTRHPRRLPPDARLGRGHAAHPRSGEPVSCLVNIVLRAATRYLDKVILSYNLARNDQDPWRGAREGIVYYCQNAKPILKTSVWIVILERLLSFVVWLVLLTPAAAITVMLPASVRELGGIVTVVITVPARSHGARRIHKAVVPDHDDGAVPRADREPADQSGMGHAAQRDFRTSSARWASRERLRSGDPERQQ